MDTARSSNGWWKTARRWACRRRDSGEVSSPYAKGSTPWINSWSGTLHIRHAAACLKMYEINWNRMGSSYYVTWMLLWPSREWWISVWDEASMACSNFIMPWPSHQVHDIPGDSRSVTESRSNANISKAMVSAQNCKGLRLCRTQPLKMGNVAWESPTSRARWTPTCHICHICHSHPEKCHSNATGGMTSPNASNIFKYHQMHSTCGFDAYVPESSM